MNKVVLMLGMAIAMLQQGGVIAATPIVKEQALFTTCVLVAIDDDIMSVQAPEQETIIEVNIYDLNGNLLITKSCNSNLCKVDISSLHSGVYLYEVVKNTGICRDRFSN